MPFQPPPSAALRIVASSGTPAKTSSCASTCAWLEAREVVDAQLGDVEPLLAQRIEFRARRAIRKRHRDARPRAQLE